MDSLVRRGFEFVRSYLSPTGQSSNTIEESDHTDDDDSNLGPFRYDAQTEPSDESDSHDTSQYENIRPVGIDDEQEVFGLPEQVDNDDFRDSSYDGEDGKGILPQSTIKDSLDISIEYEVKTQSKGRKSADHSAEFFQFGSNFTPPPQEFADNEITSTNYSPLRTPLLSAVGQMPHPALDYRSMLYRPLTIRYASHLDISQTPAHGSYLQRTPSGYLHPPKEAPIRELVKELNCLTLKIVLGKTTDIKADAAIILWRKEEVYKPEGLTLRTKKFAEQDGGSITCVRKLMHFVVDDNIQESIYRALWETKGLPQVLVPLVKSDSLAGNCSDFVQAVHEISVHSNRRTVTLVTDETFLYDTLTSRLDDFQQDDLDTMSDTSDSLSSMDDVKEICSYVTLNFSCSYHLGKESKFVSNHESSEMVRFSGEESMKLRYVLGTDCGIEKLELKLKSEEKTTLKVHLTEGNDSSIYVENSKILKGDSEVEQWKKNVKTTFKSHVLQIAAHPVFTDLDICTDVTKKMQESRGVLKRQIIVFMDSSDNHIWVVGHPTSAKRAIQMAHKYVSDLKKLREKTSVTLKLPTVKLKLFELSNLYKSAKKVFTTLEITIEENEAIKLEGVREEVEKFKGQIQTWIKRLVCFDLPVSNMLLRLVGSEVTQRYITSTFATGNRRTQCEIEVNEEESKVSICLENEEQVDFDFVSETFHRCIRSVVFKDVEKLLKLKWWKRKKKELMEKYLGKLNIYHDGLGITLFIDCISDIEEEITQLIHEAVNKIDFQKKLALRKETFKYLKKFRKDELKNLECKHDVIVTYDSPVVEDSRGSISIKGIEYEVDEVYCKLRETVEAVSTVQHLLTHPSTVNYFSTRGSGYLDSLERKMNCCLKKEKIIQKDTSSLTWNLNGRSFTISEKDPSGAIFVCPIEYRSKKKGFGGSTANTATSGGLFGQTQQNTTLGGLNQTTNMFGGGSAVPGTTLKFNPPTSPDTMVKNGVTTNISVRHQCITAMQQYQNKSLEELRTEDYSANRKGKQQNAMFGATPVTQSGGFPFAQKVNTGFAAATPFGGTAPTSTGTGLFGQSTQQTGGLFGGGSKPLFGTSTATSNPTFSFGGAATTTTSSLFGGTQNKPALFGTTPASTQSSLFGGTSTSTFGASTGFGGTTGFGASQPTGGLFGAKPGFGTATTSAGGFGTQTNLFAKPTSQPGLFGQTSTATTGFGGTTGFGFGTSTLGTGTGASTGLFGAKPGGFGAPTAGGATGTFNFPGSTGGMFGTTQNKPTGFTAFGSTGPSSFTEKYKNLSKSMEKLSTPVVTFFFPRWKANQADKEIKAKIEKNIRTMMKNHADFGCQSFAFPVREFTKWPADVVVEMLLNAFTRYLDGNPDSKLERVIFYDIEEDMLDLIIQKVQMCMEDQKRKDTRNRVHRSMLQKTEVCITITGPRMLIKQVITEIQEKCLKIQERYETQNMRSSDSDGFADPQIWKKSTDKIQYETRSMRSSDSDGFADPQIWKKSTDKIQMRSDRGKIADIKAGIAAVYERFRSRSNYGSGKLQRPQSLPGDICSPSFNKEIQRRVEISPEGRGGYDKRKKFDSTLYVGSLEDVLKDHVSSIGHITVATATGTIYCTGFRAGSDYVISTYHGFKEILDDLSERPWQHQDNFWSTSIFIKFGYKREVERDQIPKYFFHRQLEYMNEDLDVIVLKLKPNGTTFPPKLFLSEHVPDSDRINFFGYPNGEPMKIDPGCPVQNLHDGVIHNAKFYCQINYAQFSDGYINVDNPNLSLYHCYFQTGASGSPGVIVEASFQYYVVCMLLRGYPTFIPQLSKDDRSKFPPDFMFEQCLPMTTFYKVLKNDQPLLCDELFADDRQIEDMSF